MVLLRGTLTAAVLVSGWAPLAPAAAPFNLITQVSHRAEVLAFTGQSDTDPRCLERLSDGRLVFFDSQPGADALILLDPAVTGPGRFTVIATEAQLLALAPNTGSPANASVSDICRDAADNLYAVVSETTAYDNYVVRLTPGGGGGYTAPVLATDLFDGGMAAGGDFTYHRVQATGTHLFLLYDNLSNANDTSSAPGSNGIHTFDLTLLPGTTANLQMLTSWQSLASVLTPAPVPGTDAIGLFQIELSPDGSWLYGGNTNGSGGSDGDIVRISTATGAATLLIEQPAIEAGTAESGHGTTQTALAVNPSNGNLILLENGTSTTTREHLLEFSPSGQFLGLVHSHDQLRAALPSLGTNFDLDSANSMAVAPDGEIFLWMAQTTETLVRAASTLTHPAAPSAGFIWPVIAETSPSLTSSFGPRQLSQTDPRHDWHRGLDIPLPIGSRVYAPLDGVIRLAGPTAGFADPVVQVRHGSGATALYSTNLHMSGWPVAINTPVNQGDLVGLSGTSASGFDHLHYEVRDGGTTQDDCRHPLGYLPTADSPPPFPVLVGANLDAAGHVLVFDVSTPRTEIDIDGMRVAWGSDVINFSFDFITSINPGAATDLDDPALDLGGGLVSGVIPDRTSADYLWRFAFAGLDPMASTGTASVLDVNTVGTPLTVNPSLPDLTLTPALQFSATPAGGTAIFNHTVQNTGAASLSLTLSATSAHENTPLTVSPSSFGLSPGQSQAVTVTVTHGAGFPAGVGDAIVLTVDAGAPHRLVALDVIGTPFALPAGVPVGLSLLGEL